MPRRVLLLISPPVLHASSWWANRIANKPHLASLAGAARPWVDIRVLELDLDSQADPEAELAKIPLALLDDVSLVGISCWTSLHYLGTRAVGWRVRQLAPDMPIVVGGHHPTAAPGDFDHSVCDWLVRGDGEGPLGDLCRDLPARPPDMEVIEGGVFDQSDPSHIKWETYRPPGRDQRALWVGTSRGCAFQCRFCVEPQRGPTYSRYSVADTLGILDTLVAAYGPRVVAFSDPLFGADRRWTREFLDGVEARDLPLMFWAETRADFMTPELLEQFKRCRFMLDFGLDTASLTMVERMHKAPNPRRYLERTQTVLQHANAIGLLHKVYLIFNFPGETPETVAETMAYIEGLGAGDGPMSGWLSCQTFFILPGTHASIHAEKNRNAHGTEIRHPHWWREVGDHYTLATDILPSAAWAGREEELRAFVTWNQRININWASRYPDDVMAFRQAFYTA